MKKQHILKQLLLGLAMLLVTNSNAQFQITTGTNSEFMGTDPIIRGVGIGNFPNMQITDAALHVNTNYMTTSSNYPGINFGKVFQTDCPDITSSWSMHKFDNATSQSYEYGRIYSADAIDDPAGLSENFHFYIGSSFSDDFWAQYGEIRFNTPTNQWNVNTNRMRIMGGVDGFVGIGDYSVFTPQNLLHQHSGSANGGGGSPSNYHQFTNNQTGITSNDGLLLGIADQIAIIKNQEDYPILMYTDGKPRLWMHKRFINSINQTGIGINASDFNFTNNPKSILHLGENYSYGGAFLGWRTWMNIGTFCSQSSDLAFFGEMDRNGDTTISVVGGFNDVVIAWGDNDALSPNEADNLRFIFSGIYNAAPGNAGGWMGLEVGRFLPTGRFGVGNFTTPLNGGGTGIDPLRRVEIYDEHLDPYLNTPAPQLRLTYTPKANVNLGINTDFQTTLRGDLYIHPTAEGVNRRVGINRDDPRTTLEINSNGNIITNPRSGLQFTDMTNASPHGSTNGGVLSLDANGEVIFVDDIGGGNISSSCGTLPANYITKATGSSTICQSGIYENSLQDVGIGTIYPLNAKVNIKKTVTSGWVSGISIETDGITNVTGCFSKQTSGTNATSYISEIENPASTTTNKSYYSSIKASTSSNNTGFETHLLNTIGTTANTVVNYGFKTSIGGAVQSSYSYGFHVQSYYANYNYGVWVDAIPTTGNNTDAKSCGGHFDAGTSNTGTSVVNAFGVEAYAHGGSTANYGVSGKCNSSATDNYAIYGEVIQPNSSFNNYAGYFAGNVYATGSITSSDLKLKTNIMPLNNGLNIINQLKPKYYDYLTALFPTMNLPNDNHAGLIAQDLELVLPALVKSARQPAIIDSNGIIVQPAVDFKGVNYPELIPYLIAAIQEQQLQIDSLITALSNGNPIQPKLQNQNTIEVELNNQTKIILNQNDPNPFAESTTINYFIPESSTNVQLLFYDNTGTILKTIDIKEKGQGSVLVYGSNLTSGIYTYTLLADGKIIESKRMVKVK